MSFNTTLSFGKLTSTFTLNKSGRKWELTVRPGDDEAKKQALISFNQGAKVVQAGQTGSAKFWAKDGIEFYWHIPFDKDTVRAYRVALTWNAENESFNVEVGENTTFNGKNEQYNTLAAGELLEGTSTIRFAKARAPRTASA